METKTQCYFVEVIPDRLFFQNATGSEIDKQSPSDRISIKTFHADDLPKARKFLKSLDPSVNAKYCITRAYKEKGKRKFLFEIVK